MNTLETFIKFREDNEAWEMFIEGQAGTGKTTSLYDLVQYCIDNNISYIVCAFTHDACKILRSKLPKDACISTLHSFLTKRPTLNEHATNISGIEVSKQVGKPELVQVMFCDELSNVGERDKLDIDTAQDPDYTGKPLMKVVYIGDPHQLPPVKDVPAVIPCGAYHIILTKIWRQAEDNPLIDTLSQLVRFINKEEKPSTLITSDKFIRGIDLIEKYQELINDTNIVLLAYTNERVEAVNAHIACREYPKIGDDLFSPTVRQHYEFTDVIKPKNLIAISRAYGDDPLGFGSKYKTLEHLIKMDCCDYMEVVDAEDNEELFAVVFGHYQYKLRVAEYQQAAVDSNKAIELQCKDRAKTWAMNNKHHPLARARSKAWRDYLTFKECVICMDFPYAMTIHKSQGSTFDTVLIDTNDLGMCANRDYTLYLKLLYVAISRASNQVYTN